MYNLGVVVIPTMAEHLGETSSPRKELFSASDERVLEGWGLESKKSAPGLDNSPWGEPLYCEPINFCPCRIGGDWFF